MGLPAQALANVRETTLRSATIHLVPLAVAALILRTPIEKVSPFLALAWGAFLMVSFAGWGIAVERWLLERTRLDWGLRCGLGMAFVAVFAGGLLALLHLAVRPTLIAIAIAGTLLVANEIANAPPAKDTAAPPHAAPRWVFTSFVIVLGIVLCLHALGWAVGTIGNGNDDPIYHQLAKDFLARGTSIQPFSFRRLCTYGAHEVLLAMFIVPGVPAGFLNMFDEGLAPMILAVVVLGAYPIARPALRPLLALAAAYVLFVPVVQMNIASQGTTLLMVVIVYRAIASGVIRTGHPQRAIVAALPIVALCALKNSNVVPAGALTLAAITAISATTSEPERIRRQRAIVLVVAILAMLLPFVILSQLSGGSPLFPLLLGNYQRDYGFMPIGRTHARDALTAFVRDVVGDPKEPQPTWILFALVLFLVEDAAILAPMFVAPIVLLLTMALATPNALMRDVVRYSYGFQHGAVIAACLHLATTPSRGRSRRMIGATIAIATLLFQVRTRWPVTGNTMLTYLTTIMEHPSPRPDTDLEHVALQAAMAPGSTALVLVEAPNHFDARKQRIWNFDFLEAVTPRPHVNAAQGVEPFAAYLQSVGVRYLVAMKPGMARDFYRRSAYDSMLVRAEYPQMAKHTIDVLDAVDELAKTRGILSETASMFVIDLAQPPLPQPPRPPPSQ